MLLRQRKQNREAEVLLRAAAVAWEKLAAIESGVKAYWAGIASCRFDLGVIAMEASRWPEADESLRAALAANERLAAVEPGSGERRLEVVRCLNRLAGVSDRESRPDQALEFQRQASSMLEKMAAARPDRLVQMEFARNQGRLGLMLGERLRYGDAAAAQRSADAIWNKLRTTAAGAAAQAARSEAQEIEVEYAGNCINLGHTLLRAKQPAEAMTEHLRGAAALDAVLAATPENARARLFLRNARHGEAMALEDLGRFDEAAVAWRKALELSPSGDQPLYRFSLGRALASFGRTDEAIRFARELVGKGTYYDAARLFALCSAAPKTPAADKEQWQTEAIALLAQVGRGSRRDVLKRAGTEADFVPLRSRADFKALLAAPPPEAPKP
jgi:tetratricopeptide (TPR) repeat protein